MIKFASFIMAHNGKSIFINPEKVRWIVDIKDDGALIGFDEEDTVVVQSDVLTVKRDLEVLST